MATNYNPAAYKISDTVLQNIGTNDEQNRQNLWTGLSSLAMQAAQGYQSYKMNDALKSNMDESGNVNQEGYIAALAKFNPLAAVQQKKELDATAMGNIKLQADASLKMAQAQQQQALASYNNAKSHSEGTQNFINQLSANRPTNQQEYDNFVAKAKSQGYPVEGFEGKAYTPDLIEQAKASLASYKDLADKAMNEKKLEIDKFNADSTRINSSAALQNANTNSRNADATSMNAQTNARNSDINALNVGSQIDYRNTRGQVAQNGSTLDQQKFAEQKNQNQISNSQEDRKLDQGDRKINIDDKQANASIKNMNIKNQADALDRVSDITKSQNTMADMASTVNQMLSFPIEKYVGKLQTLGSGSVREAARSNTELQNFLNTVDRFKSQSFLDAIQAMKGMGALSNAEGDKLAAGYSALNVNSTPEEFRKQLTMVYNKLNSGYELAQNKVNNVNNIFGSNLSGSSATFPSMGGASDIYSPDVRNQGNQGSAPVDVSQQSFQGVSNSRLQELMKAGYK